MIVKSKFANNNTLSIEKRIIQLRHDVNKKYGLSLEKAQELRNQPCQICGIKAKKMCIDHIIPKTYRGVLCQQCNGRLGWLEKHLDIILIYKDKGPQNEY